MKIGHEARVPLRKGVSVMKIKKVLEEGFADVQVQELLLTTQTDCINNGAQKRKAGF